VGGKIAYNACSLAKCGLTSKIYSMKTEDYFNEGTPFESMKPLKAKEQLTVLLPKEINYGHTIEEAEEQEFITEVIEQFAMMQAHNFLIWLANEQYQHIGGGDWSNGEQVLNASDLYQKFIESDIKPLLAAVLPIQKVPKEFCRCKNPLVHDSQCPCGIDR
jgi:hypothetical protein